MFRVLSDEEAKRVTRWQAPELKGSVPIANTRQVATPVNLGDVSAAERLAPGPVVQEADARVMTQEPAPTGVATTNVPLASPSADMLQASYDEGYALGYAEGNAQLHQQSIAQLQALINSLGKPRLTLPDAEIEQEVLSLSLEIARLVLGRELETDASAVASMVQRGIEHLPGASDAPIQVHLHPLDVVMLDEFAQWPENVQIIGDADLQRSDCRISSGASTVHAGKEDWLRIVAAELGLTPVVTSSD